MKKALVIGAGWAGLSAAVELAEKGFCVTLLEQSGRLGGRACSFVDSKTGTPVDNGQHLFMGCYTHTIAFLKKIGALEKLKFQKDLLVDFVGLDGKMSKLACWNLPAPWHLLSGLFGLGTLSLKDKLAMLNVYQALKKWRGNSSFAGSLVGEAQDPQAPLDSCTVEEWLKGLGQSERSRRYFWDLITLATLNEQASIAQASALAIVLKEAFFASREKSKIGMASVSLSELCGPGTEEFLNARGGKIEKNQLVCEIVIENNHVQKVRMRDHMALKADIYVSAVPFFVLKNLLGPEQMKSSFFAPIQNLESAPIFSISLWFDGQVTDHTFVGMLDTQVQWLFNKGKILSLESDENYLSLVISGAHAYLGKTNEEILKICLEELHRCFPKSQKAKLTHWLIQREKNATLSPKVGYEKYRLPQKTPIDNFFLCGDWTMTGFPATIESAVLSGVKAARQVEKSLC
jgi:squalene-associated FAD-dependent desaturase